MDYGEDIDQELMKLLTSEWERLSTNMYNAINRMLSATLGDSMANDHERS